jgi:predicted nucleic acid-binding protein
MQAMATVLVDSSVLLDLATDDPDWGEWSGRRVWDARETGEIVINAMVYAEVASAFDKIEVVDRFLAHVDVRREDVPWAAAFVAGQIYKSYRKEGGRRATPLPDFFVAAHASLCGYDLLSRDGGFFRTYFPKLNIIHPDTHP